MERDCEWENSCGFGLEGWFAGLFCFGKELGWSLESIGLGALFLFLRDLVSSWVVGVGGFGILFLCWLLGVFWVGRFVDWFHYFFLEKACWIFV